MREILRHILSIVRKGARELYLKAVGPRSPHEDLARREFILNVILLATIALLLWSDFYVIYAYWRGVSEAGIPFAAFSILVLGFAVLYVLSRRGHFAGAAYAFVAFLFISLTYAAYVWGPDLPSALLGFGLLIVISSILVSPRFSFVATAASAAVLIFLAYAQEKGVLAVQSYWRNDLLTFHDGIQYSFMLGVITVVSWLSNREIDRSLRRARRSEAALREERNLLEEKVEERTRELRKLELDRVSQLAKFAEVGRLATGMVHDLLSLLTAVSLTVEELERKQGADPGDTKAHLENAIRATRRMENLITAIRKRMSQQEVQVSFSLNFEIEQVMQLLDYKAKSCRVRLHFVSVKNIQVFGDPLKFHQVIANLLSNAIDAYDDVPIEDSKKRQVEIRLSEHKGIVRVEVEDKGSGIPQEYLEKIFDPFFTTKEISKGTGLGLATVKYLVEDVLRGKIRITSSVGEGTMVKVEFAA